MTALFFINDILDLSKVESGKLELVNTVYLFHSTINDVISIIKMRQTNPELCFAVYMQHDIPNELFAEFAQFDIEKNRNVEGTGLGLAITHNLVKLMGGEIKVFSEYGKGSEFTIRLPQKRYENAQEIESEYGARAVLLGVTSPSSRLPRVTERFCRGIRAGPDSNTGVAGTK